MPWPNTWDREQVRSELEEAAGAGLSVDDPLPDTLMATAQALALQPVDLRLWIHDSSARKNWTAGALTRWARTNGLAQEQESSSPIPEEEPGQ
jgi:hypothetical protein